MSTTSDTPRGADSAADFDRVIKTAKSQFGRTLLELSAGQPVFVLFLRHSGCTFCREALADLRGQRELIEQSGTGIAVVHMGLEDDQAAAFFGGYGLNDIDRFSDPAQELYRAFELRRGTLGQLLGPRVWWRGMQAFFGGNGLGLIHGDGLQMPGAFVVHHGKIVKAYRHETAGDRPNYIELACAIS